MNLSTDYGTSNEKVIECLARRRGRGGEKGERGRGKKGESSKRGQRSGGKITTVAREAGRSVPSRKGQKDDFVTDIERN